MGVPPRCFALSGLAREKTDSRAQAVGLGFVSSPRWGSTNTAYRYSIGELGMAVSLSAIGRVAGLKVSRYLPQD
jgi:hypothetical protein